MTNNMTDSSFALVPEEAARQEIENLRAELKNVREERDAMNKRNSELLTTLEEFEDTKDALKLSRMDTEYFKGKFSEKTSELERSEADYKKARQERDDYKEKLTQARTLTRSIFIDLVSTALDLDEEEVITCHDLVFRLSFPDETIETIMHGSHLYKFNQCFNDVPANSGERLRLFDVMIHAVDDAIEASADLPF